MVAITSFLLLVVSAIAAPASLVARDYQTVQARAAPSLEARSPSLQARNWQAKPSIEAKPDHHWLKGWEGWSPSHHKSVAPSGIVKAHPTASHTGKPAAHGTAYPSFIKAYAAQSLKARSPSLQARNYEAKPSIEAKPDHTWPKGWPAGDQTITSPLSHRGPSRDIIRHRQP